MQRIGKTHHKLEDIKEFWADTATEQSNPSTKANTSVQVMDDVKMRVPRMEKDHLQLELIASTLRSIAQKPQNKRSRVENRAEDTQCTRYQKPFVSRWAADLSYGKMNK